MRTLLFASRQELLIDKISKPHERLYADAGLLLDNHALTTQRIEHPTWNSDSQIIVDLHNDRRLLVCPQPPNHSDFKVKKWMEAIGNPNWTELMSSVSIPCVIASQPISSRQEPACTPCRLCWDTSRSAPPWSICTSLTAANKTACAWWRNSAATCRVN